MRREMTSDLRFADAPSTISTYMGGTIDPNDPDPDDIDIVSIAHSLSQQCRWTGHTISFYSVAEHCVLASHIWPTLGCLLHDASEAYLSDLARPLKMSTELGEAYREAELRLETAIAAKFQLTHPWNDGIKYADSAMLRVEAHYLMPGIAEHLDPPPPHLPRPHCWEPATAKREFLQRYEHLSEIPWE